MRLRITGGISRLEKEFIMNMKIAAAILALSTTLGVSAGAEAKGCLKGALVGAIGGHVAGNHGVAGAAAGCAAGHYIAKRKDEKRQAEMTQPRPDPRGATEPRAKAPTRL